MGSHVNNGYQLYKWEVMLIMDINYFTMGALTCLYGVRLPVEYFSILSKWD